MMKTDKQIRSVMSLAGLLGLATAGVGLHATAAHAEVITASSGHAWSGNADTCFRRDWGRVTNVGALGGVCDGALFTIGARAITGTRTFRATGCSAGNVSCAAIITDRSGWNVWWTGQVQLTTGAGGSCTPSATTLGTGTVSSTNGVVFECKIDQDGVSFGPDYVGTVEY